MASSFRANVAYNIDESPNLEFTPDGTTVFYVGDLVYLDTSTHTVKQCGADPSLILGLSEVTSELAKVLTPNGKVPIRALTTTTVVAMPVNTTASADHEGTAYGVVKSADGIWQVDISDTSNTRVLVLKVDVTNKIYYVRFLAANLQLDAIAS